MSASSSAVEMMALAMQPSMSRRSPAVMWSMQLSNVAVA
jgi:hypothetical protein